MNVKYDAEFAVKAPPGFNTEGEMKRQVFDSPLIFDKDGRCIQGGKECEVIIHVGSDQFIEIKEKEILKEGENKDVL